MQINRMHAAVDDLYRVHGRQALRLAYLLTGDRASAEDIVQDAFVRLLGRLRAIRDSEALRAYLSRTIVNLAKNHHRGKDRLRYYVATQAEAMPATGWMPDIESRDEVHQRLLSIPYRQRAALVLRYCEDLSEYEVSEVMNVSPKAVRSLVGRGLAALRNPNGRIPHG